jgi:hypothetical protein
MHKIHKIKMSEAARRELIESALAGHITALAELFQNIPTNEKEKEDWMFSLLSNCAVITRLTTPYYPPGEEQ